MAKKILLVDDMESERLLLSHYLEAGGYTVTLAKDGNDGLEKVVADRPDAIVTDLVMPDLTGLEFCRRLKKNPQTADIPVIACTNKDRKMDQSWAKKQGVIAYVVKPCTAQQLCDAVRAATL
ncbi:MAG: PleD family two-component system response regulator [Phormidesmis sp.]